MISLFLSFAFLLVGYIVYGRVTEKIFAPDDRQTPAIAVNDCSNAENIASVQFLQHCLQPL